MKGQPALCNRQRLVRTLNQCSLINSFAAPNVDENPMWAHGGKSGWPYELARCRRERQCSHYIIRSRHKLIELIWRVYLCTCKVIY